MNERQLSIDEIASIRNKYWIKQDKLYREQHPDKEIPMESEPSDEESDLSIVIYDEKQHYIDLNNNIYEITECNQIGKLVDKK